MSSFLRSRRTKLITGQLGCQVAEKFHIMSSPSSLCKCGKKCFVLFLFFFLDTSCILSCIADRVVRLQVQFILVQFPSRSHMLHVHCSVQLRSGCCDAPLQHIQSTRVQVFLFCFMNCKQQNNFYAFVCISCSKNHFKQ